VQGLRFLEAVGDLLSMIKVMIFIGILRVESLNSSYLLNVGGNYTYHMFCLQCDSQDKQQDYLPKQD
jgi:hypothetical protein